MGGLVVVRVATPGLVPGGMGSIPVESTKCHVQFVPGSKKITRAGELLYTRLL